MKKTKMKQSTLNSLMGTISAILLIAMVAVAVYIITSFTDLKLIEKEKTQTSTAIFDYQTSFLRTVSQVGTLIQLKDATYADSYRTEIAKDAQNKSSNVLLASDLTAEQKKQLSLLNENINAFQSINKQAVDAFGQNNISKATELISTKAYSEQRGGIVEQFDQLKKSVDSGKQTQFETLLGKIELGFEIVIIIAALTFIFSVLRIFLNRFAIIQPLIRMKRDILDYANGDMSKDTSVEPDQSEIGQLAEAMHIMKTNIEDLIDEIETLTKAAVDGDLSYRADSSTHAGEYGKIVEKMNRLLDVIMAPVRESYGVLAEVASGDLRTSIKGDYAGDHARIKETLNGTVDSLNEIIYEFKLASEQVSSSAAQVSGGSEELSQGATEQASSIEELNATITEIAAQTRDNAMKASSANTLVLSAKSKADSGNEHMKTMLQSMSEINEASKSISKIINVIDEIAFKTNILALNAAVEAARAGQYGKGFAVVADEVKNLAEKSAGAARETAALIEVSIAKVENGSAISKDTAKTLEEISADIVKTAGLVGDIAVASGEQATAIAQLNKGIEQVAHVVQENSATAEEAAAASEELSGQAEMLKQLIMRFQLKDRYEAGVKQIASVTSEHPIAISKQKKPEQRQPAMVGDRHNKIAQSDNEFGKY